MNLKEAFRYQNNLDNLFSRAYSLLQSREYTTKTVQEHLRKKSNPDDENETKDLSTERAINVPANTLMDFLWHIIDQKSDLCDAIADTKARSEIDLDGAIAVNKARQQFAALLSAMTALKPSETITQGRGYKFNAEGNQVAYVYDIKQVTTIDFDRDKARKLSKKAITEADDMSRQLDKMLIDVEVEYDAPYDVNDGFEDVLAEFAAAKAR